MPAKSLQVLDITCCVFRTGQCARFGEARKADSQPAGATLITLARSHQIRANSVQRSSAFACEAQPLELPACTAQTNEAPLSFSAEMRQPAGSPFLRCISTSWSNGFFFLE